MMLYMAAARCPPRSEPANSHDFLPSAIPRNARSAALLERQIRPSSRKRVNAVQRLSMYSIALATSLPRESLARCSRIQPSRSATKRHFARTCGLETIDSKTVRLSSKCYSAQRAFRGIVGEADTPIIKETGERGPAFEHVLHRFGDFVAARELGALLAHPAFQISDQWRAELLTDGPALLGTLAIDGAFDLEQGVDAPDCLQGQRRDRPRGLALCLATGVLGQIRHGEERAAGMDPAGCFQDRARFVIGLV